MENVHIGKVIKTGTSVAIVIPVSILKALDIKRGDLVVFGVYSADTFAVRKILPGELRASRPEEVKF